MKHDKGVTADWHKSAFFESTPSLMDGWVRVASSEHLFVYGGHAYGNYGGVSLNKGTTYKVSFDLKLGEAEANKTFNLYVMTEKTGADPRFGDIKKTLTLNFADVENLVTANSDNFAHVAYTVSSGTAHIEAVFETDGAANTDIIAKWKKLEVAFPKEKC